MFIYENIFDNNHKLELNIITRTFMNFDIILLVWDLLKTVYIYMGLAAQGLTTIILFSQLWVI